MHQNIYNHEESEPSYQKYISNIAYRFKFKVIFEEDKILKEENGETTCVVDIIETRRNTLCWKAWVKLSDEYNFDGIKN